MAKSKVTELPSSGGQARQHGPPDSGDGERPAAAARGALPVESVRRALRVLGCFGPGRGELGVTDIASMLDMHKSTVHRLLLTLEKEGFVRQSAGRYALTWRLLEIASGIPVREGVRQATLRHLEKVVARTGETAHLAVLYVGQVLYVEKVEGTHALRMPSAVGRRVPLHCTALGKVILAGLNETERRRLVFDSALEQLTPNTITDPQVLWERVEEVSHAGYAIDHEEIEQGLMCIASPVCADDGTTCAAISIAAPASRLQAHLEEDISAVQETAAELSAALGAWAPQLRETWTR
jgi:DNA-binding IclR family transcriptional regulator